MNKDLALQQPSMLPIQPSERILTLDILRGFALFGILIVNMEFFYNPMQTLVLPIFKTAATAFDSAAAWLVRFLAEGKFYTIFSFLFGYGFTIIMQRSETGATNFLSLILRRLSILLVIGLVHLLLIWIGDILTMYAIAGFALLLFRNAKPKTLLVWAVILISLPLLLTAIGVAAIELGRTIPEVSQEIDKSFAEQKSVYKNDIEQSYRVYATGNFVEIMEQRIRDLGFLSYALFVIMPNIFAMFLVGMYFGKRQFFQNIHSNIPLLKKIFWWGMIIGLIGNATYATLGHSASRIELTPMLLLATFGLTIGMPALSLFYVSGIALVIQKKPSNKLLNYLAPVGRFALSNYLMHSLIFTTIFYGYGFGLFGQVGKTTGLLMAIIVLVIQVVLSNWWVKKFKYGPIEWLWRWGTYLGKP